MLKSIINKSLVILSGLSLIACVRDAAEVVDPAGPSGEENAITLRIYSGSKATRATVLPTEAEAAMKTVDLFFFASDADDNTPAVFAWSAENAEHADVLQVVIPINLVEEGTLFGTDNKCRVYAAANSAETSKLIAAESFPTVNQLRNLREQTASFALNREFKSSVMFTNESPKGDDGAAIADPNIVTYNDATRSAAGNIYVKRLAAKIDLFVNFAESVSGADPTADDNATLHTWTVETSLAGVPTAEVHIVNGVQSVRLGGSDDPAPEEYYDTRAELNPLPEGADEFRFREMKDLSESVRSDVGDYLWMTKTPFYTYPNSWTLSPLELHRTTLLLKVDWLRFDDGEPVGESLTTYYKVPLNIEGNNIEEGKYYRVKVKINTLGGINFGEPVTLEDCSCEVLDWNSAELDADLRETRYLEVQQKVKDKDGTEYTAIMNNTDLVTIPFFTSHETTVKSVKIRYTDFSELDIYEASADQDNRVLAPGVERPDNISNVAMFMLDGETINNPEYQGIYIDHSNRNIVVRHAVGFMLQSGDHYVANKSKQSQYTPYIIEITLEHKDGLSPNTEVITIKQYPAIYVEGEVNATLNLTGRRGADLRGNDPSWDMYKTASQMRFYGFVRINSQAYNGNQFGGLSFINKAGVLRSGTSNNPVMYIVNTTQLSEEEEELRLHVADPRCNHSNNVLDGETLLYDDYDQAASDTRWIEARHIDGGRQRLQYYYPTNEGLSDEDKYAVSPRFRVASSFGAQSSAVTRENARKRCASYSEYGYPAGRWRMPTLGELQYIMKLSRQKIIPELFNTGVVYYTAQGGYKFDSGGNPDLSSDTGYVRCVYDDWYWVNADGTPDRLYVYEDFVNNSYDFSRLYNNGDTFVWGDRPKNNPQEQPDIETTPEP